MPDAELVDTVSAALEQSERVDEHPILVTPTEDRRRTQGRRCRRCRPRTLEGRSDNGGGYGTRPASP